jgi:hypothetical protein
MSGFSIIQTHFKNQLPKEAHFWRFEDHIRGFSIVLHFFCMGGLLLLVFYSVSYICKKYRIMNRISTIVLTALLLSTSFHSVAQSAEEMKAYQNYMTPGDMHKWMAGHVGTWEAEVSTWMDPSAPPSKSKATDVVTMAMNGLFQIGQFSTSMMGMPMTGQSTLGYNNATKMFVMSWIDNFSSGMVTMTGVYDEKTKTLSLKGKQTDPVTGTDSDIRQENKFIDEHTYTMAMYGVGPGGKEMKFMEGTFKRKK